MKHSVSFTCLAIAGILIAGLGDLYAAEVAQPAMMRGGNAPHHAMHDPVAATQARLDKLGAKLNLKSSQQDAWKAFSDTMIKHAQEHAQEMEKRTPGERAKHEDLATPDKMEAMAARMRKGADNMSKLAGDTKIFYDQLSSEQKTIFDLSVKNAWQKRMPHPMH